MLQRFLNAFASIFPWGEVGRALKTLILKNRILAVLSATLVLCGVFLLEEYFDRTARYEDIVKATLEADLEETPQEYKGLEAFIMTSLNDNEAPAWYSDLRHSLLRMLRVLPAEAKNDDETTFNRDELSKASFSTTFPDAFAHYMKSIDDFVKTHGTKKQRLLDQPQLHISQGSGSNVMLSDQPPGFLFLPLSLVRAVYTPEQYGLLSGSDNNATVALINDKLAGDDLLLTDVELAHSLVDPLTNFLGNPVLSSQDLSGMNLRLSDPVVQAYLITRNGVLKIVSNRPGSIEEFYRNQFRPSMFFPGKSYFEGAFDADPNGTSTNFTSFHVSSPYLDLGGNGIVATVSKSVRHEGLSDSVLCLDIPVYQSSGISEVLSRRFEELGGSVTTVSCSESSSHRWFQCKNSSELQRYMSEHRDRLPEINGNIQFISDDESLKHRSDSVLISVPTGNVVSSVDQVTVDFLVADLDLPAYRRLTDLIGASGAICIGIVFLLLLSAIVFSIKRRKELEDAFAQIAEVMKRAQTPYSRLLSDDTIADANFAFCRLVGLAESDLSLNKLKTMKFSELIDENDNESQTKYAEVELKRKKGESVVPYRLKLRRYDQVQSVTVWIYAGAIPATKAGRDDMPETFGVAIAQ
jgi:PAS domain-containing protein